MNKRNDFKAEALAVVGLSALPKASNSKFDGIAVIKVKKITGEEVFALGQYSKKLTNTIVVARTFDKRGVIEKIISCHPYVEVVKDEDLGDVAVMKIELAERGYTPNSIKMWGIPRCTTEIDAIKAAVKILEEKGVENTSGTLEALELKIAEIND